MLICINKCINLKKVSFVVACFQASAAPRPENPDTEEKDALFGRDTQINIPVYVLGVDI
jgi:hypothetical protein